MPIQMYRPIHMQHVQMPVQMPPYVSNQINMNMLHNLYNKYN
jgi:hypothetical protein